MIVFLMLIIFVIVAFALAIIYGIGVLITTIFEFFEEVSGK